MSDAQPHDDAPAPKRTWSGARLLALIAGVALVSLCFGIAIMQFVVSPATLAARTAPPEAGVITAPIEQRIIENTVLMRGEVTYADSVAVELDVAGTESRAVITGQVPEVGAVLDAGGVALEISGRPVVILSGELPAYRNLSIGMRGPDVLQLKQALAALGYASGDLDSDSYDWDTAAGIGALYEALGYAPATGGEQSQGALRGAEQALRDTQVALAQAQAMLDEARTIPGKNILGEQAAVEAAVQARNDAEQTLAEAQRGVQPTLPVGEALFLSNLPRRVDSIAVKRGDTLNGSPMSVSGATLTIVGTVSRQDAELLHEGIVATFSGSDQAELTATVTAITAPASGGTTANEGASSAARYTVTLDPGQLTPEQIGALRGTNVRLRIPVASTDAAVLAVPIAALQAGSGGESRVELLLSVDSEATAETAMITVETGLAADGFVEITSSDTRIAAGAKVVVGR